MYVFLLIFKFATHFATQKANLKMKYIMFPKDLEPYFNTKTFYKALSTNKAIAKYLANEINMEFSKAIVMIKLVIYIDDIF